MSSAGVLMVGCGLVLAGMAAEGLVARRWLNIAGPAPLDTVAVLAFALPAVGLALMAALAA
ncbi:hypothetical protein Q8W71_32045 [Methylobacterium sp. NEAU 140]|uniref:hypothetical protein n=1 Tax=Methylobacterium sp. NEAU 140 TaxID=3064945 RepID=UPI00273316B4|nr:hypothetical protein [Methylobacterium sp. NEAU 140]MDP4027207.1 hypothetical protein [Methylobacterium sp. NEAU 140]